jgi:hypothetical protein
MADEKMLDLIRSQQGGTPSAAPEPSMSDASTPPMSAPMSTPEPKMGNKEGALVNISMAMDLIEQALPSLGSESEEGQKALAAIRSLTGVLGQKKQKTGELQQSEIIQMLQNLPQAGGATPEGRAMSKPRLFQTCRQCRAQPLAPCQCRVLVEVALLLNQLQCKLW